jgi:hypothetical protein
MRFSSGLTLGVWSVVLAAAGSYGCKKKDPEPQYAQQPYPQQQYPQQQYPQQQPGPQPTAQPTQPAPAAGACTPGPAQPMDPSAGAAVTPVLTAVAQQELPGSKPVGSALTGNFQPCQTIEAQAQLQPGKCYVVVGAAAPPVSEVNVKIAGVMPLPGSAPVMAQDSDTGVQAVIGRKPNCYKNPLPVPVPVKIILEVQAGAGVAAAQLYEK